MTFYHVFPRFSSANLISTQIKDIALYFHICKCRQPGSGAGPLPFVTGAPPRRASGAGRTAAPTDRHSPFAEI